LEQAWPDSVVTDTIILRDGHPNRLVWRPARYLI
jgi:hypothetical protein